MNEWVYLMAYPFAGWNLQLSKFNGSLRWLGKNRQHNQKIPELYDALAAKPVIVQEAKALPTLEERLDGAGSIALAANGKTVVILRKPEFNYQRKEERCSRQFVPAIPSTRTSS
jgi:hypothetical protein